MAQITSDFRITRELRPCLFLDFDDTWKKGLFHRWFDDQIVDWDFRSKQHIIKPKLMAIVEDEDGCVFVTHAIRFIDSKEIMSQYDYTIPPVMTEDELRKILSGEDSAKNT